MDYLASNPALLLTVVGAILVGPGWLARTWRALAAPPTPPTRDLRLAYPARYGAADSDA